MTISLDLDKQSNSTDHFEFQFDPSWLEIKIDEIANTEIENLSHEDQFAFYINAYNILTVYSVKKKLKQDFNWKGNTTSFKKFKFFILTKFSVGGKKINLYNLENKILRKEFKDPRIHFAINCASVSCPPLPEKLIKGNEINEELDKLTYNFINDGINVIYKNKEKKLKINPIFKWFKKDFNESGGIITFLNKYFDKGSIKQDSKIFYFSYDWNLKI